MSSDKLKIIKCLLWIMLAILLIVVIGYFVFSCSKLNDKGIEKEYFSDKQYVSEDASLKIKFSSDVSVATVTAAETVKNYVVIYTDNIFEFKSGDERVYEFIVIDESTLYGSTGKYFYLYGGR